MPTETRAASAPGILRTNWFYILLALADGELHGYAIMQDVLERTEGKVRLWPATLYGTLRRLVDEGLIEEAGDGARPEADGVQRRFYRLSDQGRVRLTDEINRLEELLRAARATREGLQRTEVER